MSYRYTGSQDVYYPGLGLSVSPGDELETRPADDGNWVESAPNKDASVKESDDTNSRGLDAIVKMFTGETGDKSSTSDEGTK